MTRAKEKQLLHDVASLKRGYTLLKLRIHGTKLRPKKSSERINEIKKELRKN